MNIINEKNKLVNSLFIRNFSIIAHVDHGKSSLASCLLKKCNTQFNEDILHKIDLEKKRGITIKLNAIQLYFKKENITYIFNLIDTPGHFDFKYEVSRSLAACEGALLLVDAVKGIQAQTLYYYEIAKELNLVILPIINKIDLPTAQVELVQKQIIELLNCSINDIILISSKTGENIDLIFDKIISNIPSPFIKNN